MGFNQRAAAPLDFNSDPLLPQADTSQAHDIPTGVSPTTAKLQDWIASMRAAGMLVDQWRSLGTLMWSATAAAFGDMSVTIGNAGASGRQLIKVPSGTVIDGIRTAIDRNNTGTMPNTRFSVGIGRKELATGTVTFPVIAQPDPTSVLASYEAYHQFDVTFADLTIDNSLYVYWVEAVGELPANDTTVVWHGSMVRVSISSPIFV